MGDSISKTLTVSTELGDVVVHKMPLSDYAELLRALETLPKALEKYVAGKDAGTLQNLNNADLIKILPGILADSFTDVVGILAVPTDKDAAFLLQLDGADAIDIIDAIMELNDFVRIANAVKKMQARISKARPAMAPTPQK